MRTHLTDRIPAYRQLRIPADAPFELKPSPGKGWGGFATRHIKKGSVILREKALFTIANPNRFDITDEDVLRGLKDAPRDGVSQFQLLKG